MLLLLESLAHLGPLGAPSLVEVKSVDFTDDVWGQGKESFHYKAQLMRSWMQSLPLPGWESELKPATRRHTSRILLRTHAPL